MILIDNWKRIIFERYAQFSGRASRSEYWYFVLANLAVYAVLLLLTQVSSIFFVLYVVWALAILIPSLAVAVRRLHDSDKSGWLLLIGLIPCGGIVVLVFLILESTPAENKYGPVAPAATS
jgi:uncharacterized membrane protein YhaH (DUF805 family)